MPKFPRMVPFYAARVEDLRIGRFVAVTCRHCRHLAELPVVPVANVVALRTRPVQVLRDSSDRFSELITNQRTRV